MTTQEYDLSAQAITAAFEEDAEQKLALVREEIVASEARLADLRRSEEVLTGILQGLRRDEPSGSPREQPSAGTQQLARGDEDQAVSEPPTRPEAVSTAERAREAGRRAPRSPKKATTPRKTAAKKASPATAPSRRGAATTATQESTLPERVIAFLIAHPGPQKAAEITVGLFGSSASPARGTQVRTTAERLVKRGQVEKERQGSTVFYQHPGADAPAATEPVDATEA